MPTLVSEGCTVAHVLQPRSIEVASPVCCRVLQAIYVMHATPDGVLHTPDPLEFVEEHEQELSRCSPFLKQQRQHVWHAQASSRFDSLAQSCSCLVCGCHSCVLGYLRVGTVNHEVTDMQCSAAKRAQFGTLI